MKTPTRTGSRRAEPEAAPATSAPSLDPRLAAELAGNRWEQSWALTPSIHTPVRDPAARQRWWTLERMLEPFARDAFALAEDPVALDAHCGEGWIAQRLLGWGARRVVAIDERPDLLLRARLLRDHYAIRPGELDLREPGEGEGEDFERSFDVVVLTGAADRLSPEEGFLPRALAATRSLCAIECSDADANTVAGAALAAGFGTVERAVAPLQAAPRNLLGERELLIARRAIGR